jgi:hypothetical protein
MGAHGEALPDALPTAATVLPGVDRRDRFHARTGARCLVREDRQEVAPAGVVSAFVQACPALGSILQVAAIPIR